MGMAMIGEAYPRPKLKKVNGEWRVYWCEMNNTIWYRQFWTWDRAIQWVTNG